LPTGRLNLEFVFKGPAVPANQIHDFPWPISPEGLYWPAIDAECTPAFLEFKVVFKSTEEPVKYKDASRQDRFGGFKAMAKLEASVRVPSIDFSFTTDPMETSAAISR